MTKTTTRVLVGVAVATLAAAGVAVVMRYRQGQKLEAMEREADRHGAEATWSVGTSLGWRDGSTRVPSRQPPGQSRSLQGGDHSPLGTTTVVLSAASRKKECSDANSDQH
jgi:hypothetical protein